MHDQEGYAEPEHHARRPMNAFLIFCKRHRSVVREKYPNLENRSITKILGEWWGNLDIEEKNCYTDLAKNYKDAFLSANPDFQWYKLPAPPIRLVPSRRDKSTKRSKKPKTEAEKTNNNSTKVDFNKKPKDTLRLAKIETLQKPLPMFTPGKLADEAQMGGLSSLLTIKTETQTTNPYFSPPYFKYNTISNTNDYQTHLEGARAKGLTRNDTIQELQDALSETTGEFETEIDNEDKRRMNYGIPNNQFTNQDVIDQIVDKRFLKDGNGSPRHGSDDEKMKSGRSCKGKRYQEFMAVGGLIVNKRQKRNSVKTDENNGASCSRNSDEVQETVEVSQPEPVEIINVIVDPHVFEQNNNTKKPFDAKDFDLDAKIFALPPISYEKYLQKKRDNKRRKKPANVKPKALQSSQIVNSVPKHYYDDIKDDNCKETVIGSQKRKPKKKSINRFTTNSMVSTVEMQSYGVGPEMKLASEAPFPAMFGGVDFFGLATLAEVAANTSKIDDYRMEANERNAPIM